MVQSEEIEYYTKYLEKVKAFHPLRQGSGNSFHNERCLEYIKHAEGLLKKAIKEKVMKSFQEKIFTKQVASAVNDKCLSLYETIGTSAVIDYANEIGLDFEYCKGCEVDMPVIRN